MTKNEAIALARTESKKSGLELTVYRCPISLGEQEGFDEPWGYCPTAALPIIARFREKEHDFAVKA